MSDRIPGSSWSNPIWHGDWRIFLADNYELHGYQYVFCHDSYDGAEDAHDDRHGLARSVEEAKRKIDSEDYGVDHIPARKEAPR